MTIFATSNSPVVTGIGVGMGSSKYTDIVTKCVNTLANGSKASVDGQLDAYQTLQSLIFSDAGGGNGGLLEQTNKNDWKRAVDAFDNSDMSKRIQQVDARFSATGLASASTAGNIAQHKLNNLARFSNNDQKIIFVAEQMNIPGALVVGGKSIYYASLDDWKTALKQQATAFDAQQQAYVATAPSTVAPTASLSTVGSAPTSLPINQNTVKAASKTGIPSPLADSTPVTNLGIALQILLSDQKAAQPETHTAEVTTPQSTIRSGTTAMHQTASSRSDSAPRAGHLDQIV